MELEVGTTDDAAYLYGEGDNYEAAITSVDDLVAAADLSLPNNQLWVLIGLAPLVVSTQAATEIKDTEVIGNGTIDDMAGFYCHRRGFCYKPFVLGAADPDIDDTFVSVSGLFSLGAFSQVIPGLIENTDYAIVAFADNEGDVSYGEVVIVTTGHTPVTDAIRRCPSCQEMFLEDWVMYENPNLCPACGLSLTSKRPINY